MGIVNTTPDSFYAQSRNSIEKEILNNVEKMMIEGVSIIDIGGYSTRPNSNFVAVEEELQRVIPAIESIARNFEGLVISIDSFRSQVVDSALEAGASVVNDISAGLFDPEILAVTAKHRAPYIMMHLKGTFATMHDQQLGDSPLSEVATFFLERIQKAKEAGITDIVLDPGFGFSKTLQQNFTLLNNLEYFHFLRLPILVGISRKSMIHKTINASPELALNGTTVLNTIAVQKGASILRVHDVREAREAIQLLQVLKNSGPNLDS